MLRIKKLDLLILRSFIGPFLVTFFIVLFVFVMQSFWLYMDELLGKGFNFLLIMELLFYWGCYLTPQALPLGILLASIMTFGNLGENYELVAIKSSGISLFRFMRPLTILMLIISVAAFLFNNYVIPVTNLKTFSLLYDMRNQKPALNIRPGIFNRDIDGYAIRVGHKDPDGQHISDIIIYDHIERRGNNNVTVAKSGRMYPSPDRRSLIFELQDGWRYEESNDKGNHEQTRMHFQQWNKVFDLSKFAFSRTREELFKNNEAMMNVAQLTYYIDSTQKTIESATKEFERYQRPYISLFKTTSKGIKDTTLISKIRQVGNTAIHYDQHFIEYVPDSLKGMIVANVESAARSLKGFTFPIISNKQIRTDKITNLKIAWHKKFTLSFACLLLFLIGAPLGAIIRKGGLGMPVIVAIGFFVIYFILSSTGEKLAKEQAVAPWYGIWIATGILLPIAVIIMNQARNDSNIFSKEWYGRSWRKLLRILGR